MYEITKTICILITPGSERVNVCCLFVCLFVYLCIYFFIIIFFQYSYDPKTADWSREMRGNPLTSTVDLSNWILIFTQRDSGNAKDFAQTLTKVCGPMGINVSKASE